MSDDAEYWMHQHDQATDKLIYENRRLQSQVAALTAESEGRRKMLDKVRELRRRRAPIHS